MSLTQWARPKMSMDIVPPATPWFERPLFKRLRVPWPVFAAAAFAFICCALYSNFVFERVPHVHDEMCYLFQAETFQMGRLYVPSPCAPGSFDFPHIVNNGRWYSMYTPGFPLLLLIGLLFHAPWLVNPLFAALSVFLLYFLGREVYDRRVGLLAAMLGGTSIWLLLMSATMMSHTTSMFFNGLFLLYFFKSVRRPLARYGLAAGASLGMAFLIRPGNAPLFALPFLVVLAVLFLKDMRTRFKNMAAIVLAAGAFVGLLLVYNQLTNGSPFKMGYIVHHGKDYAVIFGRAATLDYDYTPHLAFEQIGNNAAAINSDLFGWPLSSLLALLPLFWVARKKPEELKMDLILLAGFFTLLVGFFFFWGAFIFLGARMMFDGFPLLVLLSAKGIRESAPLLSSTFKKPPAALWPRLIAGLLVVFTLHAFFIRFPRWAWPSDEGYFYKRYDRNMAGSSTSIHNAVRKAGLHRALVIIRLLYVPMRGFPTGWWSSGFCYDTPRLDGDVIYALDQGEKNAELFRCYPDRKIFEFAGTLDRGLLVPLTLANSRVTAGQPVVLQKSATRTASLVADPVQLFRLYSPGFESFLAQTYRENDPLSVDVTWLEERALRYKRESEFLKAAYCFEAALQLENAPLTRSRLLNQLIPCYRKTGQRREAMILLKKNGEADDRSMKSYNLLPERGF